MCVAYLTNVFNFLKAHCRSLDLVVIYILNFIKICKKVPANEVE